MEENKAETTVTEQDRKKKRRWLIVFIALLLVVFIVAGTILGRYLIGDGFNSDQFKKASSDTSAYTTSDGVVLVDNPIDFDSLNKQNPDVCAWITVPNTNIDYPILQSSVNDDNDYYLSHSIDRKNSIYGCIFIERNNSKYFTDRNTVIYGHNMKNGSMFRTLHKFRDAKFFEQNEFFTIYTPGHIMTYRIFSAYRFDNRHILNSFDFADDRAYQEYIDIATNPNSPIKNIRKDVKVTTDDKIVTLSTCISDPRYRYLVQGVLISDELTK